MPDWKLVLVVYPGCPFISGEEFWFGDQQVRAEFEEDTQTRENNIQIEFGADTTPPQALEGLFRTLCETMLHHCQDMDFSRGLLRVDKELPGGGREFVWEKTAQLRVDGTFSYDYPFPHK